MTPKNVLFSKFLVYSSSSVLTTMVMVSWAWKQISIVLGQLAIPVFSFIYSFYFYRASTTTTRRSRHSTDTVLEFHAKAPQAAASEGLAQGP